MLFGRGGVNTKEEVRRQETGRDARGKRDGRRQTRDLQRERGRERERRKKGRVGGSARFARVVGGGRCGGAARSSLLLVNIIAVEAGGRRGGR
jgi:hypothetical protein